MNVCLLNDSFPPVIDGVANVVMNYAKIMQEDHLADVLVGTPEYPGTDYSIYPYRVIPYQSFDTTKIVKGYRAGNPLDIGEIDDMADFKPDIIHTHCPVASTVLGRILRAKTDAPLVFTYHTKFDIDIAKAVKAKFIQQGTIKALVSNIEACDEVWVVSQGAGENLRSLGFEGDYRVVSNGVDFAKGRVDEKEVAEVVKDYDLPKGVPVFLFVGRIMKYKGIPLILEALAKLAAKGQDFRMVLVGSGPDEEELKEMARQYGFLDPDQNKPGKCIFVGPVYDRNKLRAWNTRADLFLFPSTYDTNGIVVREAAACGLASVLIEGSCAAEGITHGRNGYMIEENAGSFSSLLEEVCKDLGKVHQVGQCAMDEIYISWKDSVYSAHKRYEEIIELKRRGRLTGKKPMLMDKFLEFSQDLVDETKHVFQLPKKLMEEVREDAEELFDLFRD
ncbi:MAG: glycosyltransferase [Clostridia bacterium]|nr:glycosyltransferase [Clostridia bacterium]